MRIVAAACSSVLTLYALAGLSGTLTRSRYGAERTACTAFGLCANETLQQSAYAALRSPDPEAQRKSLGVFRELVRRDPASATAWCDLGGAFLAVGDNGSARSAFDRASYLGGNVSPVLVRLATFSFSMQDSAGVLTRLRRVLAETSRYDQVIFSMYSRLGEPPAAVVERGIPDGTRAGSAYLRFLLARGDLAELGAAWNAWTSKSAVEDDVAAAYIAQLWANTRRDEAHRVWASHFGGRTPGYGQSTHVYNGGFERDVSQAVFDWNISAVSYASAKFDAEAAEGERSLRLTFNGEENPAYGAVSQLMRLDAGSYRFTARVKAEGLSSDQGVRFRIADPESPKRLELWTGDVRGTSEWTTVTADFVRPAGTSVVELRIARLRSLRFDNKLGGTVWIDDVKVARI